jgi:dihydrolipoamide dehydrogenase
MEAVTKFSKFGSLIKVVEARERVLPMFEEDVVDSIQETSEMYSDHIYTSTMARGVEYEDDTPVLVAERDGEEFGLTGDHIIVAAGREPKTAYRSLDLENTDVERNDRGYIEVDDRMRTTDENVFCVGDAPGTHRVQGGKGRRGGRGGQGDDVRRPVYPHGDVHRPGGRRRRHGRDRSDGATRRRHRRAVPVRHLGTGADDEQDRRVREGDRGGDGKLLGVRIVGPRASDSIAEATLALEMGAHLDDITDTIHAHPTFPETLAEAAKDAKGESIHSY